MTALAGVSSSELIQPFNNLLHMPWVFWMLGIQSCTGRRSRLFDSSVCADHNFGNHLSQWFVTAHVDPI